IEQAGNCQEPTTLRQVNVSPEKRDRRLPPAYGDAVNRHLEKWITVGRLCQVREGNRRDIRWKEQVGVASPVVETSPRRRRLESFQAIKVHFEEMLRCSHVTVQAARGAKRSSGHITT